MSKKIRIILFSCILAALLVGGFYFLTSSKISQKEEAKKVLITPPLKPSPTKALKPSATKKKEQTIPETYKIKNVPFTPQAPFAKWDHDHNEACEEAAILIVHYFNQKKNLSRTTADKEIMEMINYQKKNWGGHFDLEAIQIARLAKEYYGYKNTRIIYNATIEDIKKEISKNRPVIIPTAGRLLENPNYKRPGPLYHALVVIGYTPTKIITQDPGTRRGEEYTYPYEIIEEAMHEWNNGKVYQGRSAMIILNK